MLVCGRSARKLRAGACTCLVTGALVRSCLCLVLAFSSCEHSTRHHATNRAWRDALAAVATGTVLLGDKQEADKYKKYNEGHVADLVQPGASPWGTDWIGETKVPSSLVIHAPSPHCEHVGHLVAFGCTEEGLHRLILGHRERGTPADGPFDHTTEARGTCPSSRATTTTRGSTSATK